MAWPYQRIQARTGPRRPATRPIRRDILTALACLGLGKYEWIVVAKVLLETDPEVQRATMVNQSSLARDYGVPKQRISEAIRRLRDRGILSPHGDAAGLYAINRDVYSWLATDGQAALSDDQIAQVNLAN